jgi:hypothetical protein
LSWENAYIDEGRYEQLWTSGYRSLIRGHFTPEAALILATEEIYTVPRPMHALDGSQEARNHYIDRKTRFDAALQRIGMSANHYTKATTDKKGYPYSRFRRNRRATSSSHPLVGMVEAALAGLNAAESVYNLISGDPYGAYIFAGLSGAIGYVALDNLLDRK